MFLFRRLSRAAALAVALPVAALPLCAQTPPMTPDIPAHVEQPQTGFNYTKRVVMVPMRDGVKLYTVILVPKGAKNLPMVLTRTPYDAAGRAEREDSPYLRDTLPMGDDVFANGNYIRVWQDVRGKYGSEGDYVMTPMPTGPLNPSGPNDTTDGWDTIDWLVKNVPESNGRVGMIGSSYEGFTVVMALLHPHPALKVAAPESPMVDGWMGDDWFHYGAYRNINIDYITEQTSARGSGPAIPRFDYDDYTNLLAGSTGDFARAAGLEQFPFWRKLDEHPAYDAFWQGQALDKLIAKLPLTVPTMWEQGLWDQEDMWGGIHSYAALEPKDKNNDMNFLVMGPWRHSQINGEGFNLGPLRWNGDTALQWRRDVLLPFFNQYLVDGAPKADTPPVFIYNTGENHWDRLTHWPLACDRGCDHPSKPLYLEADGKLSFDAPQSGSAQSDAYVSDPAKPVPFTPRPFYEADHEAWTTWLVHDQRFVDGRSDVLTWETEPLTAPLRVSGAPMVHLYASTTGSDSDWVVKLIDVYPGTIADNPPMGGYELPISLDIFRGRYRTSFSDPQPITPDQPLLYQFGIPTVNHVFEPGHRIMVQVQSTLFPLYDRNPQKYVPNIFDAKPGDYQKATQKVWHAPDAASFIDLPVVPAE
jgi:putative CocE/NonD family hydrolase